MPGGIWGFIALFVPGVTLMVAGNLLVFRGDRVARRRGARQVTLGYALVKILPGLAILVMVFLGELQAPALFAGILVVGFGLFDLRTFRAS